MRMVSLQVPAAAVMLVVMTASACARDPYMDVDLRPKHGSEDVQALRRSAKSGEKHAQLRLADRYAEGEGLRRDKDRAVALYRMAAADGGGPIQAYIPRISGRFGKIERINRPFVKGLPEARLRLEDILKRTWRTSNRPEVLAQSGASFVHFERYGALGRSPDDNLILQSRTTAVIHSNGAKALKEYNALHPIKDCPNCPEMISVPSAGDDGGTLWVAVNETTWSEYLQSVKVNACLSPHLMNLSLSATSENIIRVASTRYAVTGVSLDKIECYARWLSAKKGRRYRLPTETEWERFARAGATTRFPWGEVLSPEKAALRQYTKLRGGSLIGLGLNSYDGLPVRSFAPNGAGLYDVIGNVLELTTSCRQSELNTLSLQDKIKSHCRFVMRGGGYGWTTGNYGLSERLFVQSTPEMNETGFRLVAE